MTSAAAGDRARREWYLSLNWRRHVSSPACVWLRQLQRTDVLFSAMFLASAGRRPRVQSLITAIGTPDWISGTPWRGEVYYRLYSPARVEPPHTMLLFVDRGRIVDGGTNRIDLFACRFPRRHRRADVVWTR